MTPATPAPSARREELLELAYAFVLEHGLADLSLRPLAAAAGSSPGVLMFLFGSKEGLVRALLERARSDELALLSAVRVTGKPPGLAAVAAEVWTWLVAEERRALLVLWMEAIARSLVDPQGPWSRFGRGTVEDWLEVLASAQPPSQRESRAGVAQRTLVLAVLRGALMDLLATGDVDRTTAAVHQHLNDLPGLSPGEGRPG